MPILNSRSTLVFCTNKNNDHIRIAKEIYLNLKNVTHCTSLSELNWKLLLLHRVIILPSPHPKNLFILFLCFIFLKKVIVGIHDVVSHDKEDKSKVFLYNWIVCKLASGVIVFSKFSEQELKRAFNPKCTVYTYRFVANELCNDTKNHLDLNIGKIDYLYFGRARPYSGSQSLEYIIEALPDQKFLLMGVGLPENLKIYDNACVINRRFSDAELASALLEADTVIFPYVSATQSGGVPLAIYYNCNIVYFDVGGLCDQIQEYPAKKVVAKDLKLLIENMRNCKGKVHREHSERWLVSIQKLNISMLQQLSYDINS